MKSTRNKSTVTVAVIGGIIFILVLTVGTILTGLMATNDTTKAVEAVSLFYLDELAGRREEVVSANLSKNWLKSIFYLHYNILNNSAHQQN